VIKKIISPATCEKITDQIITRQSKKQ